MTTKNEIQKVIKNFYKNKTIICHCLATGMHRDEIFDYDNIILCNSCKEFIGSFRSIEDIDSYLFSGGSYAEDVIDKLVVIDSESAERIKNLYSKQDDLNV